MLVDSAGAIDEVDELGAFGLSAFNLRQSSAYAVAKENRFFNGAPWDRENGFAPDKDQTDLSSFGTKGISKAAARGGTSVRLNGSIAVGIVIVSGPGKLGFSAAEQIKVIAEVQNGLGWLGAQNRASGVVWHYDIHHVTIGTRPDPNAEDLEALWRNPAMAGLGYTPDSSGVYAYAEAIRNNMGTDWTYVGFFTKYPVEHFAYAYLGGPHLVMQYDNDGWGPDNIDRVFAHETGHIFQAPDEYSSSNCNCGGAWGVFNVPNGNCANCAPGGGTKCIMKSNDWRMCTYTLFHLGLIARYRPLLQSQTGISGYDLNSLHDRIIAFDYDSSGKLDHLLLYRPGNKIIWIVKKNPDGTFIPVMQSSAGISDFDLNSVNDRIIAYDYDSSGKLDHLLIYRPGDRKIWIIKKNPDGTFVPVVRSNDGIADYDLNSVNDRIIAYDYDSSGKLDHLLIYRPGDRKIWIIKKKPDGTFVSVMRSNDGITDYDLNSENDRIIAYDYDSSGKLDHLLVYRPGDQKVWIVKKYPNGEFTYVYKDTAGIGDYDLMRSSDRIIAYDYRSNAKSDHLLLYRPHDHIVWIIEKEHLPA